MNDPAALRDLIGEVLPFAVGVFASPLPVIVAILLLFTPRPRITSLVYIAAWIGGVAAVTAVLALLAGAFEGQGYPPQWVTWIRVLLGALLVAAAVRQWLARATKAPPAWLDALMDAGPAQAARYGLLMSAANPKELLMALPAGLAIGSSGVGVAGAVVAIAVFVLVGGLSVIAPLAVFVLGGDRSLDRLGTARTFLQRHNAAVTAVVLAVLGLWLLVGGLVKVWG